MTRSIFFATAMLLSLATPALADRFTLTSPDIAEGQQLSNDFVFQGFGCEGGNVAPTLEWSGAPEGTESYAVTVYDPDAPTESGWWHWFVFNISKDVTSLPGGNKVNGVQLTNDYGVKGFGGACPPPGEVHRYQFTVHALNATFEIDSSVSNALASYMVNVNSLASSSITAVYNR